jgi:hypothetical protein
LVVRAPTRSGESHGVWGAQHGEELQLMATPDRLRVPAEYMGDPGESWGSGYGPVALLADDFLRAIDDPTTERLFCTFADGARMREILDAAVDAGRWC